MKMAKKGFKFSKDLLFLMGGLVIVLGILFYVIGYKVREGFYQTPTKEQRAAKLARLAAIGAEAAWFQVAPAARAHAAPWSSAEAAALGAAAAWGTAASEPTKSNGELAKSASQSAATACSAAGINYSAATTATATALGAFRKLE